MLRVLLPLICLPLCAQSLDSARQAALGRAMAEQVRKSTRPIDSPDIQSYVNQLGARLSAQMENPNLAWTFEVVSTDQSNALHEPVSLPGGYIFVPLDLFIAANNESEFAGMIAQAMARKSVVPMAAASSIPTFTAVGGRFSGNDPSLASSAQQRQIELDADKIAVATMAKAGLDPAAPLRYIERDHPSAERIVALREALRSLPAGSYSENGEYVRIRAEAAQYAPPATTRPAPSLLH